MRKSLLFIFCFLTGHFILGQSQVTTQDCNGVPGCFNSIQEAIDNTAAGGTIAIAAGTYAGNITVDKSLTFVGTNSGGATPVPTSIIQGSPLEGAYTLQISNSANISFSSLHLKGFDMPDNGTGSVIHFTGAAVSGVSFVGNIIEPLGEHGVTSSAATLNGISFMNNAFTGATYDPTPANAPASPYDTSKECGGFTWNIFEYFGSVTDLSSCTTFSNIPRQLVTLKNGTISNVIFQENIITSILGGPTQTIGNNQYVAQNKGIEVHATGANSLSNGVTITGNQFISADPGTDLAAPYSASTVYVVGDYTTVSNNFFGTPAMLRGQPGKAMGLFISNDIAGSAISNTSLYNINGNIFYTAPLINFSKNIPYPDLASAFLTIDQGKFTRNGDVLELYAGTFTSGSIILSDPIAIPLDIGKSVTINGPNVGKTEVDTRSTEAILTGGYIVTASNVEINGVSFSGGGDVDIQTAGTQTGAIVIAPTGTGFSLRNSVLTGITSGIGVSGALTGATLTDNGFSGWGTAIQIALSDANTAINKNSFSGNVKGVVNSITNAANKVNAKRNFWGSEAGPYVAGLEGSLIEGNLDIDPWLVNTLDQKTNLSMNSPVATASAQSATAIQVSWEGYNVPSPAHSGFRLRYNTSGDFSGSAVTSLAGANSNDYILVPIPSPDDRSKTVSGLSAGTTYFVQVQAIRDQQ